MKCWFLTYKSKSYGGRGGDKLRTGEWVVVNDVTSLHPVLWLLRLRKEAAAEHEEWATSEADQGKWYDWSEYRLLFYEEIPMDIYTEACEVLG